VPLSPITSTDAGRRGTAHPTHVVGLVGRDHLAQLRVLAAQLELGEQPLEHDAQLREVHRLAEVVVRAGAHRRHRVLHGGERGHHDHAHVGHALAEALHELDAAHAGHLHVGDHHVGREVVELTERLVGVACRAHGVALLAEELGHGGAGGGLVVDDQNPRTFFFGDVWIEHGGDAVGRACARSDRVSRARFAPLPPG
jgi:hypothetical protein